jgi:integral membrane protein
MTTIPATTRPLPRGLRGSLLFYRVMAFVTGVVLLAGTIGLIVEALSSGSPLKDVMVVLWTAHGYLYLVYLIAAVNLGFKMRWKPVRMVLVALSGTIPTMSFVAEHYSTRYVRAQIATRDGAPT